MANHDGIPLCLTDTSPSLTIVGDVALVTLVGELDLSRAAELRELLIQPEVSSGRDVRVDLCRVGFIGSVTIGLIVTACRRVREAGGSFSVVCDLKGIVGTVLAMHGLIEHLRVEEPQDLKPSTQLHVVTNAPHCGHPRVGADRSEVAPRRAERAAPAS